MMSFPQFKNEPQVNPLQTTHVGWKVLCFCLLACFSCLGNDSPQGTTGLALSALPDASVGTDDETSLCPPGTNRIVGTPGPDRIEGTNGADCILGLGGDDELIGQNGEDVLIGGEGNDLLIGGNGKDVLYGGDGDDHLLGGNGKDVLYGNEGDDFLDGQLGKDELLGGDGCDVLDARDGPDSASGGEGNDVIHGDNQVKQAHGDNGDDSIGISHPGGSSIAARKSPVDGGDGEDSCDGENCELPPPTACDEETESSCAPDFACVIGLCVPADRCHGGCTITDPIGDFTCDGLDDDCDGQIDEDFIVESSNCGIGACTATGELRCVDGGQEDTCSPGSPSANDATCDGIDEDCDGRIDEDVAAVATSCGVGVCAANGVTTCSSGIPGDSCEPLPPTSSVDTCNALDDDCDGQVDEDCCVPTTCADVGATCGRIESCGQVVLCGSCTSSEPVCGADYTCTSETTVRAGEDREAIWGEPLLFGRRWEFDAGSHGQFAGSSVWMDCTWDFGDGTAPVLVEKCSDNNRERPSHTYAAPGVYTVTVTATVMSSPSFPDTVGQSAMDTLTVTVRPRPSAIVLTNATATATPHTYNVHAQLADAHDGSVAMAFLPVILSYDSQEKS